MGKKKEKQLKKNKATQNNSLEFLTNYLNSYSPTGEEFESQAVWYSHLVHENGMVDVSSEFGSRYGNKYVSVFPMNWDKPNVVLEAHVDEIAWQISHIESNGICRVQRNGGSDSVIAMSKFVVAHTKKGKVKGVIGYPAIHVRKDDKVSKPADLILDFGASSRDEVLELGIHEGVMVTFVNNFDIIGDYYVSKALDNKIGGFIIAEVGKNIMNHYKSNGEFPFNLILANCVAEETGLKGGSMCAKKVNPDIAYVVDVCHHTDTDMMDKRIEGHVVCGKGGAIERKYQNHRGLLEHLENIANEYKIPYQNEIGSAGNDTISFYDEEIPTCIIGVPLKYMHTTVEMVHKKDVETIIEHFTKAIIETNVNGIINYYDYKIHECITQK